MFAVVKTGGKQYKVSSGDLLKVERLEGETGQSIHLSSVLLLNNEGQITIGTPFLEQIQVRATIVDQTRSDKIIVFKKKRRQGYRRKAGHRQDITVLRVEEILTQGIQKTASKSRAVGKDTKTAESQEAVSSFLSSMEPAMPLKKSKVSKETTTADANITSIDDNDGIKISDTETKKAARSSKPLETASDSGASAEKKQSSAVRKKTSEKSSSDSQVSN